MKWKGGRVQWHPGYAVVYLRGAIQEEVLAALVEFAFYEGELRRLEAEMDTREATANDDVSRAHTIQRRDKAHWPRFTAAIEAFTRMRLAFARLSPRFAEAARGPGSFSYRLASRSLRQSAEPKLGAEAARYARLERRCEESLRRGERPRRGPQGLAQRPRPRSHHRRDSVDGSGPALPRFHHAKRGITEEPHAFRPEGPWDRRAQGTALGNVVALRLLKGATPRRRALQAANSHEPATRPVARAEEARPFRPENSTAYGAFS